MGSIKGTATETTETPDGAHAGSSASVETSFEQTEGGVQADVGFGGGFTEPTKPYGNVKFFVELKIKNVPAGDQDDVFDFCVDWVDERLSAKMAEVKENYPD